MSKIGKIPIKLPDGCSVQVDDDKITVKGPKGELKFKFSPLLEVGVIGDEITVNAKKIESRVSALWGLTRSLIFNMVKGVTEGFTKKLEVQGVGFKAQMEGKSLILNVGFSHPIEITPPEGIEIKVNKNIIEVLGIDKQLVGQIAADIRAAHPPEVYKGKGLRYLGEFVRQKAGKRAVATEEG